MCSINESISVETLQIPKDLKVKRRTRRQRFCGVGFAMQLSQKYVGLVKTSKNERHGYQIQTSKLPF